MISFLDYFFKKCYFFCPKFIHKTFSVTSLFINLSVLWFTLQFFDSVFSNRKNIFAVQIQIDLNWYKCLPVQIKHSEFVTINLWQIVAINSRIFFLCNPRTKKHFDDKIFYMKEKKDRNIFSWCVFFSLPMPSN